jgi:hypothetical protein
MTGAQDGAADEILFLRGRAGGRSGEGIERGAEGREWWRGEVVEWWSGVEEQLAITGEKRSCASAGWGRRPGVAAD